MSKIDSSTDTARKLEHTARLVVPHLLLMAFFFFGLIPLPFGSLDLMKPQLVLMGIYYWAIYRPTLVPPAFCFGLGLLLDTLSGAPLGLNALLFVVVQWLIRDQRRFLMGQPYTTIWAVFGLVALVASYGQWLMYGLVGMEWSEPLTVIINVAVSLFLFPFITLLLVLTHRVLPVAPKAFS